MSAYDIRITYEWNSSDIRVRTIELEMTYELRTNNLRITSEILNCREDLELLDHKFQYHLW